MSSANFDEKISKWLMDQKFYHGYLPREDLPYVLKKKGDYIVRIATRTVQKTTRKDIVLSVAWPSEPVPMLSTKDIKNILIQRNGPTFYIDLSMCFTTIEGLFDHFRKNDITNQNKEKIRLIKPIGLLSWEYKHSQIICSKKVGQGAYGEVYKGKVKKGAKSFDAAIKAMRKDLDAGDEKMKEVMAEARLMRSLNHPNIVRCRGIAVLEQPLYIVIDFITGGGLDSFLKKNGSTLTMDQKNKMGISAAWGIEFMHNHDIIHRDIAARNCLYDKKNLVKLSDFGLSRKGSVYKMKKAMKMPTRWLAPESLSTFTFSRASDVYTFGVLLYEIYTCQEPYLGNNAGDARKNILSGAFPDFEKKAPPELYDIVKKKIYQLDPLKRAPMNEASEIETRVIMSMFQIVKNLEHWLEVELVLDQDEKQPDVDPESNRAQTSTNPPTVQTTVEETPIMTKTVQPLPPVTPPPSLASRQAAKSRTNGVEPTKNSKEHEQTPEMASTSVLHKMVDKDKREMDELQPPPDDCIQSPSKETESIGETPQRKSQEKDKK